MFIKASTRRRWRTKRSRNQMTEAIKQDAEKSLGQEPFNWKNNLLTVELLIGAVVVVWYLASYLFQVGKFSYYHLPSYYIDLNINKLLEPGIFLGYFFLCIVFLMYYDIKKTRPFVKVLIVTHLIYGLFYFSLIDTISNIPVGGKIEIYGIVIFYMIILPILRVKFQKRWKTEPHRSLAEKLDQYYVEKYPQLAKEMNLNRYLVEICLGCLVVILGCSYFFGYATAKNTEIYYVIEEKEDNDSESRYKIVFDTYQQYYITAPYDPKKRTYHPDFELKKLESEEKIPPVKVVKNSGEFDQAEKKEEELILHQVETGTIRVGEPTLKLR